MSRPKLELPIALAELDKAIRALVEPNLEYLDGQILNTPSIFDQIGGLVAGMQGTSNGHANRSMPPIWIDAVSIVNEIELCVGRPAAAIIRAYGRRCWTPDEVHEVVRVTKQLEGWVKRIENLLDPPRKMHIAAPCPACEATTVKHMDSAGEEVNGPALSVEPGQGCTCLECGAFWPPHRYMLLAKVLDLPAPAGVIE